MPRCENKMCGNVDVAPDDIHQVDTSLFCGKCVAESKVVSSPDDNLVLGREFDYAVSYTREHGLKAGVRLGGARLSLQVDPAELSRAFGSTK